VVALPRLLKTAWPVVVKVTPGETMTSLEAFVNPVTAIAVPEQLFCRKRKPVVMHTATGELVLIAN